MNQNQRKKELISGYNKLGGKFFTPGAMSFFNSEIEFIGESIDGNIFFITSERMELDMPKAYTVRLWDGENIKTVSEFREFSKYTVAEASMRLRELQLLESSVA